MATRYSTALWPLQYSTTPLVGLKLRLANRNLTMPQKSRLRKALQDGKQVNDVDVGLCVSPTSSNKVSTDSGSCHGSNIGDTKIELILSEIREYHLIREAELDRALMQAREEISALQEVRSVRNVF